MELTAPGETANQEGEFRILVAEDEVAVAGLLRMIIGMVAGSSATFTDTAEKAIELARKAKKDGKPFSLILTDNGLAGRQNGFDLAAAVQSEGLSRTTWMISGGLAGKSQKLVEIGVSKFIAKPFNSVQMVKDIVNERASQQRQQPAEK